jgi:hypothetical protein
MSSVTSSHPIEPNPGTSFGSDETFQAPEGTASSVSQPASSASQPATSVSQPASQKSDIWVHFKKAVDYPSTKQAICVHCGKRYVCSDGNTSTLWRHIKRTHSRKLNPPATIGPLDNFLGADAGAAIGGPGALRRALVKWTIVERMPFTAVESPTLRDALRIAKLDGVVPSATTVKRDIMGMFDAEKARMRALLQEVPGKLSFAVDGWTSPNMKPFLGITAHWTDGDWCLQEVLLDLVPLAGPHSGENLCKAFVDTCTEFGILTKLLAVTTDNATNNDTFLEGLGKACEERGIRFTDADNHVRCLAHVINLAVQAFLAALKVGALDTEDDCLELSDPDTGPMHCIPKLRKLVVKIRSSPQRRETLAFQCRAPGLTSKQLIVDVRTRWNSTFLMLERALELRGPLGDVATLDKDLHAYQITDEEWSMLETVCDLLKMFKRATDCLSGSTYPTLNAAIPVYNYLMDMIEDFMETHRESAVLVEAARAAWDKLSTYYSKSEAAVYAVATVIDPSLKLDYHRRNEWEDEYIKAARGHLGRVFGTYWVPAAQSRPVDSPGDPESDFNWRQFINRTMKRPRIAEKDELGAYLASPPAEFDADALQWWKANAKAYPRLAEVARDYLAIPASGAAVERMFSGGTDLVVDKRGSLSAEAIRACMCLMSWEKAGRRK